MAVRPDTPFVLGGREFTSRLMVGTGKYASTEAMMAAITASGAEVVTVAVRRVDLSQRGEGSILHALSPERFFLLANTAGCYTADDAVRYARLARAAGFNEFIKLEVIGDEATLRFLIDRVGAERVVMGSDWPFVPWHPSPVKWLEDRETLSAAEKEKILWKNLSELLDIR